MLYHIIHQPLCQIIAAGRYKKAAAALAGVHFKQLVFVGAGIKLHVKVGKSFPAHILQKGFHFCHQCIVTHRKNGGVVANALGGLLFQQGAAQRHQMHLMVQTGVTIQHAHTVVIAGNILLQDQRILIAAAVNGGSDLVEFLLIIGHKHLFLVGEVAVPIGHAVAGLDDARKFKGKLNLTVILHCAAAGFGIAQAVLFTGFVKVLLHIQIHYIFFGGTSKFVIRLQRGPVAGQQNGVAIAAAQQHQRFAGMLGGKVGKGFYKHLVLFQAGLYDNLADKAGVAGGYQPGLAHHGAGDMIFHKETARHAVHVGIAAQKNR